MGPSNLVSNSTDLIGPLHRLLTGIEVIEHQGQLGIVLASGVPDFITAHPEVIAPATDAELVRQQADSETAKHKSLLAALQQVLQMCRKSGGAAALRAAAETPWGTGGAKRTNVSAFVRVTPSLEAQFEELGVIRTDLALMRDAILRSENSHRGSAVLCKGLAVLWPIAAGVYVAVSLFDAGVLWATRKRGDRSECLERAIECFEDLLTWQTREADAQVWADISNNLGAAYLDRLEGDHGENLECAMRFLEDALTVITREVDSQVWAQICGNLGSVYMQRRRGDRSNNHELAINFYKDALAVKTRSVDEQGWGQLRNNLGIAYAKRLPGDPNENLEDAIDCYQDALTVRTPENDERGWATTMNDLGAALMTRRRADRAENLEHAIRCFTEALTVKTQDADPHGWAEICNHLGISYANRLCGEQDKNLERPIEYHQDALEVLTSETDAESWVASQQ